MKTHNYLHLTPPRAWLHPIAKRVGPIEVTDPAERNRPGRTYHVVTTVVGFGPLLFTRLREVAA